MQEVVQLPLQKLKHETLQRRTVRPHFQGAELRFGLGFEHRLLDLHGHRRRNAAADVLGVVVLAKEVPDHPDVRFTEGRLVRPALRGVLAVDEALVVLAIRVGVRDGHFDVFS